MALSDWTGRKAVGIEVINAVKAKGLDTKAQVIAIMVVMTESSMVNVGYGDIQNGQMTSSRGCYQQISAWGPLADRLNVTKATNMFLDGGAQGQRGLLDVSNWRNLDPWVAAQAVQGSEFRDGSNYRKYYDDAVAFVKAYSVDAPAPKPTTTAFPLRANQYFGPFDGPAESISGQYKYDTDAQRAAVKRIQQFVGGVTADGHYGDTIYSETPRAVKKWQATHNLTSDGLVGPVTWKAMGL